MGRKIYKTIDLCAGIGGIRRGFEMTGRFQNVISAEIDKYACKTYKHLFGDDANNDLTTEEFKKKLENVPYDVLLAGFPCQTFSRAGLEEGFAGAEKGIIFAHIANIIKRTRPKAVFLENVDNLVRHNKGQTFHTILIILEDVLNYRVVGVNRDLAGEISYDWRDFIRNSRNFGVPQNRPRTYIMAFDRERYGDALNNFEGILPDKSDKQSVYRDLNDLLELGANVEYYMSANYWETLKKHREREHARGNGYGYRVVNAIGVRHPIANTILATGGSGKERNLVYDPQIGVSGVAVRGKRSETNSEFIRVMTPREWGKLQGFVNYAFMDSDGKDRFSFPEGLSKAQKYKQFGNSVTIPVIETMADFMVNCLDKM